MYNRFNALLLSDSAAENDGNALFSDNMRKRETVGRRRNIYNDNRKNIDRQQPGYNNHRIFESSSRHQQQSQLEPDWEHILDRIRSYAADFPHTDDEGIVHLRQGQDFLFCDQFVNTIRYGAEVYKGLIVHNFAECPNNFFNELFKHVTKTQYPEKFIPLVSFTFATPLPWPSSNTLVEIPRHLEPTMLRKGDNSRDKMAQQRKVGQQQSTAQRVMYSLQNDKTGAMFLLKIWFDPANGELKYKQMKGMTLRKA